VRFSDALGDDRLHQRVGPYSIEVVEPLRRIRLACDGDEHGIGFDLTWEGSFPAVQEAQHVTRNGRRVFLDASRFAQLGTWAGVLRFGGDEVTVDPARWVGARDRSWGLRPVGEPEPPGRPAEPDFQGFWWAYSQLRFDDFAVVLLAQEEADGYRVRNDAAPRLIAEVAAIVAAAPGPALVQCAAGKDRTGVVIAVILLAAGVEPAHVIADYTATAASMPDVLARMAARLGWEMPPFDDLPPILRDAPQDAIAAVIDVVASGPDGAAGWLASHGMTPAELDRLRAKLSAQPANSA
jgi:Tyrosine phosphatase family